MSYGPRLWNTLRFQKESHSISFRPQREVHLIANGIPLDSPRVPLTFQRGYPSISLRFPLDFKGDSLQLPLVGARTSYRGADPSPLPLALHKHITISQGIGRGPRRHRRRLRRPCSLHFTRTTYVIENTDTPQAQHSSQGQVCDPCVSELSV